jgi:hypothetical protein
MSSYYRIVVVYHHFICVLSVSFEGSAAGSLHYSVNCLMWQEMAVPSLTLDCINYVMKRSEGKFS